MTAPGTRASLAASLAHEMMLARSTSRWGLSIVVAGAFSQFLAQVLAAVRDARRCASAARMAAPMALAA